MSGRERTAVVFARYSVFQIPGMFIAAVVLTVLVRWETITENMALLLFGFWVLKDLVLFPITRVGYERGGRKHGAEALVGSKGVVKEEVPPGGVGWVRVGSELWRAELAGGDAALPPGAAVRVVAIRGLVLSVEIDAE